MITLKSWWIFAVLSAIFAALTTIFAKVGVESVNSNLATAIRTGVVLAIAWIWVIVDGEWSGIFQLSGKTLLFLILSGLATGLSWLCYFKALQQGSATGVAALDKSSLVFIFLLSVVFLGETINLKSVVGIALIFVGVIVLVL